MLGFAIVGCGMIARFHARALAEVPGTRIAALVSRSAASARKMADELKLTDCVLATNTSALSISELADATKSPERVVGIHFFNPVHRMQLVEVVVGRRSRPDVVQRALRFVQQIGKLPVVVKDSPGFLVNRILMPYLIEAGHLFEAGASEVESSLAAGASEGAAEGSSELLPRRARAAPASRQPSPPAPTASSTSSSRSHSFLCRRQLLSL